MDQSQQPPITHLLFNAGLQFTHEISYTEDGYKKTFAVNHLSHALLFSLLILHLILHLAQKACIVVTASRTHNPTQKTGIPDAKYTSTEELAHPTGQELNNASHQHYTTSKRVNMLWTYTLKQHLASLCGGSGSSSSPNKDNVKKDWTVAAFNTSLVPATGLAHEAGSAMEFMWGCVLPKVLPLLRAMVSLNIHTAEESRQDLAWLAGDVKVTVKGGLYYEGCKEIKSSEDSYDRTKQEDSWDWTVKNIAEGLEEADEAYNYT